MFDTVDAQILIFIFGRVQAAETHDKLLYFGRARAGYVVFNVHVGDLEREKRKKTSVCCGAVVDDGTHIIAATVFTVLHVASYVVPDRGRAAVLAIDFFFGQRSQMCRLHDITAVNASINESIL